MSAPVVRHLPGLSVADRCALEQEARRFELAPERREEMAAHLEKVDAYLAGEGPWPGATKARLP